MSNLSEKERREAALAQLRERRAPKKNAIPPLPSSSSASDRNVGVQPAQNRDASKRVDASGVSSRHFATPSSESGAKDSGSATNVLVPETPSPARTERGAHSNGTSLQSPLSGSPSTRSDKYVPRMGHHPPGSTGRHMFTPMASSAFKGKMMKDERPESSRTSISQYAHRPSAPSTTASSSRASSVRQRDEDDESADGRPKKRRVTTNAKGDSPPSSSLKHKMKNVVLSSDEEESMSPIDIDSSPDNLKPTRRTMKRGRRPATDEPPTPSPPAPAESSARALDTTASSSATTALDLLIAKYPDTARNVVRDLWRNENAAVPRVEARIRESYARQGKTLPPGPLVTDAWPELASSGSTQPQPALVQPTASYSAVPITRLPKPPPTRAKHVIRTINPVVASSAAATRQASPPRKQKTYDQGSSEDGGYDDESDENVEYDDEDPEELQRIDEAVKWFNEATAEALVEVTACTVAQAQAIISVRPFKDDEDIRSKLQRKKGVSPKFFDEYLAILRGYNAVDTVLVRCEKVGKEISDVLGVWANVAGATIGTGVAVVASSTAASREGSVGAEASTSAAVEAATQVNPSPGVNLVAVPTAAIEDVSNSSPTTLNNSASTSSDPSATTTVSSLPTTPSFNPELVEKAMKGYLRVQPSNLKSGVLLKDYQLLGINWLGLLHSKKLSCILADEMGLGKTVQVISFFAMLKEKGVVGHSLVVVPSSTLENWGREFEKFCPTIRVRTYYGSANDRIMLRTELIKEKDEWDVLITTYNLAQGNEHDRKFFTRRFEWDVCVYDEGHVLKNFQSQRYTALIRIPAKWRLLLTGTPLQNNLQELVSIMNFILPSYFRDSLESLRAIFKVRASSHTSLLSRSRVSRASKMMTPFVLRRRKDQVLKDLPKKTERIEWCEMTALQRTIYDEAMHRTRKVIAQLPSDENSILQAVSGEAAVTSKPKAKGRPAKKKAVLVSSGNSNSSHVLMDLRKASCHPMLFRRRFDDAIVNVMARACLKEPEFADSVYDLVVEDMQVMNDAELQHFCKTYKSVKKYALNDSCYLDTGKLRVLMPLLESYKKDNRRVLIFSQFTQVLTILQTIFDQQSIRYLTLTGATPVAERQSLVDEFTEDEGIPVFLLSTKAGGLGITLTAACVVILFDQDFNPHNDKQACDRAYRIGQKRDVEVVRLITRGTIEESMLKLGEVKLELDQAVAGEGMDGGEDEDAEGAPEKAMKASLLSYLRKEFEEKESTAAKETQPSDSTTDLPNITTEDTIMADGTTTL